MDDCIVIFPRGNGKRSLRIITSPKVCEYFIKSLPKNEYGPVCWKTNLIKYIQDNMRP